MRRAVLIIVGLVLMLDGRVYAYNDGDFQVWHTENQEFKINKKSKITMEEEFRWGDDADDFYYHHYDAGLTYSLNKYLDVGANYRQVFEEKKGRFKEENRPHINATLRYELGGFKLDDRNRIEYRRFDYQTDSWRYRNKLTVKFPYKLTRFEIQPYAADEIFVELNNVSLSRNRLYSGLSLSLTKNIKGEVYYLLQTTKVSGQCTDANVLGTKLKLTF